jgi:uncharacterized protein (TIGR00290 family)
MLNKKQALFSWSGGKDSALALHHILQGQEFEINYLLTTINEHYERVAMHGVREALLIAQAQAIGLPLWKVSLPEMPSMEVYEAIVGTAYHTMKENGINHAIFGDIFLEDLKLYRESQLAKYNMETVFPLWGKQSNLIINEFLDLGYQTIVVCAQDGLQDFCGRIIDQDFINDLPENIDPCGENGEFHTFVFDGPIFKKPIAFDLGEKIFRSFNHPVLDGQPAGFWYIDLIPK